MLNQTKWQCFVEVQIGPVVLEDTSKCKMLAMSDSEHKVMTKAPTTLQVRWGKNEDKPKQDTEISVIIIFHIKWMYS